MTNVPDQMLIMEAYRSNGFSYTGDMAKTALNALDNIMYVSGNNTINAKSINSNIDLIISVISGVFSSQDTNY